MLVVEKRGESEKKSMEPRDEDENENGVGVGGPGRQCLGMKKKGEQMMIIRRVFSFLA